MTTFAEAHAQRVAEFRDVMFEEGFGVRRHPHCEDDNSKIDRAVERLHRLWTVKPVVGPVMKQKWKCPLGHKDCTANCGNYGCGN